MEFVTVKATSSGIELVSVRFDSNKNNIAFEKLEMAESTCWFYFKFSSLHHLPGFSMVWQKHYLYKNVVIDGIALHADVFCRGVGVWAIFAKLNGSINKYICNIVFRSGGSALVDMMKSMKVSPYTFLSATIYCAIVQSLRLMWNYLQSYGRQQVFWLRIKMRKIFHILLVSLIKFSQCRWTSSNNNQTSWLPILAPHNRCLTLSCISNSRS